MNKKEDINGKYLKTPQKKPITSETLKQMCSLMSGWDISTIQKWCADGYGVDSRKKLTEAQGLDAIKILIEAQRVSGSAGKSTPTSRLDKASIEKEDGHEIDSGGTLLEFFNDEEEAVINELEAIDNDIIMEMNMDLYSDLPLALNITWWSKKYNKHIHKVTLSAPGIFEGATAKGLRGMKSEFLSLNDGKIACISWVKYPKTGAVMPGFSSIEPGPKVKRAYEIVHTKSLRNAFKKLLTSEERAMLLAKAERLGLIANINVREISDP